MTFRLEDSTLEKVPPLFEEMVKGVLSKSQLLDSTQRDIFVTLINFIMCENGFVAVVHDAMSSDCVNIVDDVIPQDSGVTEISYILSGFSDIKVKLIISPLGATILVNVFINVVNSEVYSICLSVSQYVVSPSASTIPTMFSNLKQLSYIFKNQIISPVKSSILNYCGYSSASMMGLPEELIIYIFLKLPIYDIINAAKSCKRLSSLLENLSFWHKLFVRDFSNEVIDEKKDWKKLYINAYIAQQDSKTRPSRLTGTLHDLMDFSDFVSYIDNPLWDVII